MTGILPGVRHALGSIRRDIDEVLERLEKQKACSPSNVESLAQCIDILKNTLEGINDYEKAIPNIWVQARRGQTAYNLGADVDNGGDGRGGS